MHYFSKASLGLNSVFSYRVEVEYSIIAPIFKIDYYGEYLLPFDLTRSSYGIIHVLLACRPGLLSLQGF